MVIRRNARTWMEQALLLDMLRQAWQKGKALRRAHQPVAALVLCIWHMCPDCVVISFFK